MKPLLILGSRTLAVEIADIASDVPGVEVVGFVENMDRAKCGQNLEGLPVYWVDDIASMTATHVFICALGTTHRSRFVDQAYSLGCSFATIIHPSARVSRRSTVGEGSIVSAGAVVATHTAIGKHVIINRGALVGHHDVVGDFASIMPGANIAGACSVGRAAYIGMGAIIVDHTTVGAHSVVAAGAVVTKDVEENVQVMGVPARIVKQGIEGR